MTHNVMELDKIFTKSAKAALFAWRQSDSDYEDLKQKLWEWYLETPSTQKKMADLSTNEAIKTARMRALQLLSKEQLSANNFRGMNLYSSDSVKAALAGTSTNRYLKSILPIAMADLDKRNSGHAEALRSRYEDGIVPSDNAPQQVLKRAVKSLTEHINVIAITAGATMGADGTVAPSSKSPGIGRRDQVFPEHRRMRGGPVSDPTGNTALMLIDHPELRDEYLYETPLKEFLGGKGE